MEKIKKWLRYYGMPQENIDKCATQIAQGYGACRYLDGVNDGAEWHESIELAEDHAMLAGMEKMKEQMMKDAVDGIVGYYNQRGLSISMNLPKDLEENDKVKVIIIKQHKLS